MNYEQWRAAHPDAARDLEAILVIENNGIYVHDNRSEGWTQQQIRMAFAREGGILWRNNVGATPHKCPACGVRTRPIRYGLCNETSELNRRFKSSDLIGIKPIMIKPHHVGGRIGQFVAIDAKRVGWTYKGNAHESAQAAYQALVMQWGGEAYFSSGVLRK